MWCTTQICSGNIQFWFVAFLHPDVKGNCLNSWLFLFSLALRFMHLPFPADPEGPGLCAMLLTIFSFILVLVTMPFSLCVTVKVSELIFILPRQKMSFTFFAFALHYSRWYKNTKGRWCFDLVVCDQAGQKALGFSLWCLASTLTKRWTWELSRSTFHPKRFVIYISNPIARFFCWYIYPAVYGNLFWLFLLFHGQEKIESEHFLSLGKTIHFFQVVWTRCSFIFFCHFSGRLVMI